MLWGYCGGIFVGFENAWKVPCGMRPDKLARVPRSILSPAMLSTSAECPSVGRALPVEVAVVASMPDGPRQAVRP